MIRFYRYIPEEESQNEVSLPNKKSSPSLDISADVPLLQAISTTHFPSIEERRFSLLVLGCLLCLAIYKKPNNGSKS